jgi:hypothetical protein
MMRGKFLRLLTPTHNYSQKSASASTIPMIIFGFILLFLCVWLSSQAVKFNYEINGSVKTRDRLKTANRTLEIKLQSMMSSEGVAKAAKERYGFKTASDGQIQLIKKEKNLFEYIRGWFRPQAGKI